jgi:phosphatidylglycerol:prolipoprotein diacylglycerol transferase
VRPELFKLFDVSFPAYFLLLLSGFIFATASGAIWAKRIGKDPDVIVDLGLACLLMGVVGGRLLHVVADG